MDKFSEALLAHTIVKIRDRLNHLGFKVVDNRAGNEIVVSSEQYGISDKVSYQTMSKLQADGVIRRYKHKYAMGCDPFTN